LKAFVGVKNEGNKTSKKSNNGSDMQTNLKTYTLCDTAETKFLKRVQLTHAEMIILNYAYALNHSPLRYIP